MDPITLGTSAAAATAGIIAKKPAVKYFCFGMAALIIALPMLAL